MDTSASIRPADILTVRECGNSLVETFRQRALKVRIILSKQSFILSRAAFHTSGSCAEG